MTLIAVLGAVMLVGALVGAVAARRKVWGLRLQPATANPTPPTGPIVLAAFSVGRGAGSQVTPVLADWIARGVLQVRRSGPELAADSRTGSASGPTWNFVVRDASQLDAVEARLLAAFVPDGSEAVLENEDTATRDRISSELYVAYRAQRAALGERQHRAVFLGIVIDLIAVVGALLAIIGSLASGDLSLGAWVIVGAVTAVGVTIALCGLATAPTEAERSYRQRVIDIGEWVKTTNSPNPKLGGWAMLWDLPGAWATAMPEDISGLRFRDRAFHRGDAGRRVSTPI